MRLSFGGLVEVGRIAIRGFGAPSWEGAWGKGENDPLARQRTSS